QRRVPGRTRRLDVAARAPRGQEARRRERPSGGQLEWRVQVFVGPRGIKKVGSGHVGADARQVVVADAKGQVMKIGPVAAREARVSDLSIKSVRSAPDQDGRSGRIQREERDRKSVV